MFFFIISLLHVQTEIWDVPDSTTACLFMGAHEIGSATRTAQWPKVCGHKITCRVYMLFCVHILIVDNKYVDTNILIVIHCRQYYVDRGRPNPV